MPQNQWQNYIVQYNLSGMAPFHAIVRNNQNVHASSRHLPWQPSIQDSQCHALCKTRKYCDPKLKHFYFKMGTLLHLSIFFGICEILIIYFSGGALQKIFKHLSL